MTRLTPFSRVRDSREVYMSKPISPDREVALLNSIVGAERLSHARRRGERVELRDAATRPRAKVMKLTTLERYRGRGQITPEQAAAGATLCRDWRAAGLEARVTQAWDLPVDCAGAGHHLDPPEHACEARQRVRKALAVVGAQLTPVVVWVACEDQAARDWARSRGLPESDGIARLRAGLDALAEHYGMVGRAA